MTQEQIEKEFKKIRKLICCSAATPLRFGVLGEDNIATENREFSYGDDYGVFFVQNADWNYYSEFGKGYVDNYMDDGTNTLEEGLYLDNLRQIKVLNIERNDLLVDDTTKFIYTSSGLTNNLKDLLNKSDDYNSVDNFHHLATFIKKNDSNQKIIQNSFGLNSEEVFLVSKSQTLGGWESFVSVNPYETVLGGGLRYFQPTGFRIILTTYWPIYKGDTLNILEGSHISLTEPYTAKLPPTADLKKGAEFTIINKMTKQAGGPADFYIEVDNVGTEKIDINKISISLVYGESVTLIYDGTGNFLLKKPNIGYKVYTALLTQTGTNAPTATVLHSTLNGTLVWTYSGVGSYVGTLTGEFIASKTTILVGGGDSAGGNAFTWNVDASTKPDSINLNIFDKDSGTQANDLLYETTIEIRVYR